MTVHAFRTASSVLDADAGGAFYSAKENRLVGAQASRGYIAADTADSPIVQADRPLAGGLFMGYRF